MFNNYFFPEQQLNERGEQHVQAAPKAAGIEGGTGEAAFPGELRPGGMRRVLFIAYRRASRQMKTRNRPRLSVQAGRRTERMRVKRAQAGYLIFALLLTDSLTFGLVFHLRFQTLSTWSEKPRHSTVTV